jgi:hypothetical protein
METFRTEIQRDHITVAYGFDHLSGYFLSVYDDRLETKESKSNEANDIALKVGFMTVVYHILTFTQLG